MSKQDRQIVWDDNIGFYKGKELLGIWFFPASGEIRLCLHLCDRRIELRPYATVESAKRGAERFLRRLQEAVK